MDDVERMYINGEWVHAERGAAFDVINPADRSVIARVTNGAVPDVERAVTAAHAAFREWSVQAPKDRGRFLLRIQELRSEEHTSELQSRSEIVCRLLLEKKNDKDRRHR